MILNSRPLSESLFSLSLSWGPWTNYLYKRPRPRVCSFRWHHWHHSVSHFRKCFQVASYPSIIRSHGRDIMSTAVIFFSPASWPTPWQVMTFCSPQQSIIWVKGPRARCERVAQYVMHLQRPVLSNNDHLSKLRMILFNDHFLACSYLPFQLLWKITKLLSSEVRILS